MIEPAPAEWENGFATAPDENPRNPPSHTERWGTLKFKVEAWGTRLPTIPLSNGLDDYMPEQGADY